MSTQEFVKGGLYAVMEIWKSNGKWPSKILDMDICESLKKDIGILLVHSVKNIKVIMSSL